MRWCFVAWFVPLFALVQAIEITDDNIIEDEARTFVHEAEEAMRIQRISETFAEWAYATNITDDTQKVKKEANTKSELLNKKLGKEAQAFDITQIKDYDVKRKLKLMKNIGTAALNEDKLKEFISLTSNMATIYSTAKVLEYGSSKRNFSLEPELTEILANSRKEEELQYYWEQWREASGKKI